MFEMPKYITRYKGACCSNCVNRQKAVFSNPSDTGSEWMCALDWADVSLDDCCEYHIYSKEVSVRAR